MKIYISGPITGKPNKNKEAFYEASERLKELHHEPLNPFDLDYEGFNPTEDWVTFLKRDLKALIDCDAICLLSGWEESKGACLEVEVAKQLSLPIYYLRNKDLAPVFVVVDVDIVPMIPSYLWQNK